MSFPNDEESIKDYLQRRFGDASEQHRRVDGPAFIWANGITFPWQTDLQRGPQMKMAQPDIDASRFIEAFRGNAVRVEVIDGEHTLPPLADVTISDCYPVSTLRFHVADQEPFDVLCWKFGRYLEGPQRQDNGEYIGPGWHFIVDEDDNDTCGRPTVLGKAFGGDPALFLYSGDNVGGEYRFPASSMDEAEELGRLIMDALGKAYTQVTVLPADDEDVAAKLWEKEAHGTSYDFELYAGNDAGRPVYTFGDSEEIWDSPQDMFVALGECLMERGKALARRQWKEEGVLGLISALETKGKSSN